MADTSNPLTDGHCDTLDCVLQRINMTHELIGRCENCGINLEAAKEKLNQQYQLASLLKQTFFPNRA